MFAGGEARAGDEIHEAETAVIRIDDAGSVLHVENDVVMGFAARHAEMEEAGGALAVWPVDGEAARHAEMHDEDFFLAARGGFQMDKDVFGAAAEMRDAAAGEALGETFRQREAEIRTALRHMRDDAALQRGREAAADGFDFGQFGHRVPLVKRGMKVARRRGGRHELIPVGIGPWPVLSGPFPEPAGSSACLENGLWSAA